MLRKYFFSVLFISLLCWLYWCRIQLWFRLMGGLQAKSMTSQRYRAVTRWRICVTVATLWQQQDGGYALLFYIFNSTVIDWTCFFINYRSNGKTKSNTSCKPQIALFYALILCDWSLEKIHKFGMGFILSRGYAACIKPIRTETTFSTSSIRNLVKILSCDLAKQRVGTNES